MSSALCPWRRPRCAAPSGAAQTLCPARAAGSLEQHLLPSHCEHYPRKPRVLLLTTATGKWTGKNCPSLLLLPAPGTRASHPSGARDVLRAVEQARHTHDSTSFFHGIGWLCAWVCTSDGTFKVLIKNRFWGSGWPFSQKVSFGSLQ